MGITVPQNYQTLLLKLRLTYKANMKLQNDLLKSNKIITYLATASVSPFDSRRRLYNNDKKKWTSLTRSTLRPTSAKHIFKSKQLVCKLTASLVVCAAVISRGLETTLLLSVLKFRVPYYLGSHMYAEVLSRPPTCSKDG